jgi:hypothetical protein
MQKESVIVAELEEEQGRHVWTEKEYQSGDTVKDKTVQVFSSFEKVDL